MQPMQPGPNPWQPPPNAMQPVYQPPVPSNEPGGESPVRVLEAVGFVFRNPNTGHNLLVASVFFFIPFVGAMALQGWLAETIQRMARRHPQPIPRLEFSDLGHYIGRGVAPLFASMAMMLPLMFLVYGAIAVAVLGGAAVGGLVGEPIVGMLVTILFSVVAFVLSLGAGCVMNAVMMRAELTEDFGAAFRIGSFLRLAWGRALVSGLLLGLLTIPIILVGELACIIGMYPALVVIMTASTNLRGQLYLYYLSRGGEPAPIKPPVQLPSEAAGSY